MTKLIVGLLLFFSAHSMSIIALGLRDRLASHNELGWKLCYAMVSLAGLILITWGYSDLRQTPTILYVAPYWLRHVAALLLIPTFMLLIAPYFPGRICARIRNPQLIAVKVWATAHLLVNGAVADALLFGTFLLWAVASQISMKKRPVRSVPSIPASRRNDLIVIAVGLVLYLAFVFWLHESLIGVKPFAP